MRRSAVLVVRPDDRFSEVLRENGREVINLDLIRTEPIDDFCELVSIIHRLDQFDGIFLTSPVAAEIFLRRLKFEGQRFTGKVYVLGERAKAVLDGSELNLISSRLANTAQDLIESFDEAEFRGKNLLFIRGDRSVRTIPEMLGGIASLSELVVYKTVEAAPDDSVIEKVRDGLRTKDIGWTCFFSPSAVDSFMSYFGHEGLTHVKAAVIGRTTALRASEVGFDVAFISERSNAEDFAAGFAAYINNIE